MSYSKPKSNANAPSNITELRDDLLILYSEAKEGMIKLPMAKEAANIAGKVIKSALVQLEYSVARKEIPKIPFLDG